MTDFSTTTALILDPIAGDCWARHRLCRGIKEVSVPSELMKSLTIIVGVVFIGLMALPELNLRFLHDRWADSGSDCGRLLALTPASQSWKILPPRALFMKL